MIPLLCWRHWGECQSCLGGADERCRLDYGLGHQAWRNVHMRVHAAQVPRPKQKLIHVHADASELGRVYQADLPINASPRSFAQALAAMTPPDGSAWKKWREEARKDYQNWQQPTKTAGSLQMAEVMAWLRKRLPDDAIITNGAGNFAAWIHRFFHFRQFGTQLAPGIGVDGLWCAGCCRREASLSCAHRCRILGRRLLPNDGARICDCDAI